MFRTEQFWYVDNCVFFSSKRHVRLPGCPRNPSPLVACGWFLVVQFVLVECFPARCSESLFAGEHDVPSVIVDGLRYFLSDSGSGDNVVLLPLKTPCFFFQVCNPRALKDFRDLDPSVHPVSFTHDDPARSYFSCHVRAPLLAFPLKSLDSGINTPAPLMATLSGAR